jgi:predicted membrane protein
MCFKILNFFQRKSVFFQSNLLYIDIAIRVDELGINGMQRSWISGVAIAFKIDFSVWKANFHPWCHIVILYYLTIIRN